MKNISFFIAASIVISTFSSCALGVLLFYRDVRVKEIYRSADSKRNYFKIDAATLSHCGCTELYASHYVNKKKAFHLFYNNDVLKKTVYRTNGKVRDTLWLVATTKNHYSIPFDAVDSAILKQIDAVIANKPKDIVYALKPRPLYKGYVREFRFDID